MNLLKFSLIFVIFMSVGHAQILVGGAGDIGGGKPPQVNTNQDQSLEDKKNDQNNVDPTVEENPKESFVSKTTGEKLPKQVINAFSKLMNHEVKILKKINTENKFSLSDIVALHNFLYVEFLIQEGTEINKNQIECGKEKKQIMNKILTKKIRTQLKAMLRDTHLDEYLHVKHLLSTDDILIFRKNMSQLLTQRD